MAEKLENTTIQLQGKSIPADVIEAILSRLPVKSLVRFQILSKSYKATISEPVFAKINYNHLSKTHNLFLSGTEGEPFYRMKLEGRLEGGDSILQPEELAAPFGAAFPLCSCNGLVLLGIPRRKRPRDEFVLWNPSIRKYATVQSPINLLPPLSQFWTKFGLYHDSRTDDYKIVIISERCNSVFSCKTRTWVEEEPIPVAGKNFVEGTLVDGCFYWPNEREILCFDLRERKAERLKLPDDLAERRTIGQLTLIRMCGRLWLFSVDRGRGRGWMRENHGWRKMLIEEHLSSRFVIYSDCEKRYKKFERWYALVPYSESLFFPLENGDRVQIQRP